MRLQVALAKAGVASRRKAAEIIERGHVKVDGRIIREKGFPVEAGRNAIFVDGKKVVFEEKIYILLNKPKGVITTVKDTHGRKTVLDLVGDVGGRIYPVGRLDKDTTGALILTNDGNLAYRLTHPKFGVEKIYRARTKGRIKDSSVAELERGVLIEGGRTAPCRAKILREDKNTTEIEIAISEGRKRQIKKMLLAVGHPVIELHRLKYGNLGLGNLKPGQWRKLTKNEIGAILKRDTL